MDVAKKDDFVGRHLIVDASTYNRRNLTSTDTVFALFEALARNLDMTLVLPPIVCRYPFANDELQTFCDDIELELDQKMKELAAGNDKPIDLSLAPVRIMREFLRRRQLQEKLLRVRRVQLQGLPPEGRPPAAAHALRHGDAELREPLAVPAHRTAGDGLPDQRQLGGAGERQGGRRAGVGELRRSRVNPGES
jgi:hypothetical protein